MRHIKLDAIRSTNDFLKDLLRSGPVDPFTVVSAREQIAGRGQMGSRWISQKGKNLTFSVFCPIVSGGDEIFIRNAATALGVVHALDSVGIPEISVKWPNDIMAGRKKIGGILIENILSAKNTGSSVIGIGLNVNQTDFPELPQAGSLATHTGNFFDLDELLETICRYVISQVKDIVNGGGVWDGYKSRLFSAHAPSVYEDLAGRRFNAMIADVDAFGRLVLEKEDGTLSAYGIKEIKMLY